MPSETLYLAPEGVFPLVDRTSGLTSLGLPFGGTLQGEGLLAGMPSLFIRLAGCNLRCTWTGHGGRTIVCDTPQALAVSHGRCATVSELIGTLEGALGALTHLVITGGEPLTQAEGLVALLKTIRHSPTLRLLHITLETNGTLFNAEVAQSVDLVSLSPKWNATPQGFSSRYIHVLQCWLDAKVLPNSLQLKFVVGSKEDEDQIANDILPHLNLCHHPPILVMPLGATPEELRLSAPYAVAAAIRHNWRFCPRLQVELWGNRAGT